MASDQYNAKECAMRHNRIWVILGGIILTGLSALGTIGAMSVATTSRLESHIGTATQAGHRIEASLADLTRQQTQVLREVSEIKGELKRSNGHAP